ncbi:hypothetical protein MMC30_000798 [Trapelia coarctata]|nr:hypothetical protein [Trapelia coarctata]
MEGADFIHLLSDEERDNYWQSVDGWVKNDLNTLPPAGQDDDDDDDFPADWSTPNFELPLDDRMDGIENWVLGPEFATVGSIPAEGNPDSTRPELPREYPGFASDINPGSMSGVAHTIHECSLPLGNEQTKSTGSRRRDGRAEWEEKRALITSLWVDENRSLEETRRIMAEQHGFDAPQSAYKSKFREWKVFKNIKARHMRYIRKIKKLREGKGKETEFFLYGKKVDSSRIRGRQPVSGTPTIGFAPPHLTWKTPRTSQISNSENQLPPKSPSSSTPEQTWAEPLIPTHMSSALQSQAVPDVDISKTEAFWNLKARLLEILHSQRTLLVGHDVSSSDALGDILLKALGDFATRLRATGTTPASVADFALSASFAEETRVVQKDIKQGLQKAFEAQVLRVIYLPVLTWQAQCLVAAHRSADGEALLGKVLNEYEHLSGIPRARHLKRIHPVIMLMGKAYLAQENLYTLERVIQSELRVLSNLGDLHVGDLFEESLSFKKLLFIGRTWQTRTVTGSVKFSNPHYSTCQAVYAWEHATLAQELPRSAHMVESELWMLGILDVLRYRYEREMDHERLKGILTNMKEVFESRLTQTLLRKDISSAWTQEDRSMVHSIFQRMLLSHYNLRLPRMTTKWDRFLEEFFPPDQAPSGPSESSSDFEYTMSVMGHLFRRFLGEWPSIDLPSWTPAAEPVPYF